MCQRWDRYRPPRSCSLHLHDDFDSVQSRNRTHWICKRLAPVSLGAGFLFCRGDLDDSPLCSASCPAVTPPAIFASNPAATPPPPTPAVNGVVADPTGAIVPGAEVDLVDTNGTVAGSCHSGDDGTFQLVPPHSGNFTLVVSEPGFETDQDPCCRCRPGIRGRQRRPSRPVQPQPCTSPFPSPPSRQTCR